MLSEDIATSFHEAGHAVSHVVTGLRFRYVTVRPRTRDHTGHIKHSHNMAPGIWHSGEWEAAAICSAAGIIAEDFKSVGTASYSSKRDWLRKLFVQRTGRIDMHWFRDTTRYAFAMERHKPGWSATEIIDGETPVDLAKKAWRRAIKVVATYWESVEEVAYVLLDERPTLTYNQVSSIVNEAKLVPEQDVMEALKDPHYWDDWFLYHSRLKWEPSKKWYREVDESVLQYTEKV